MSERGLRKAGRRAAVRRRPARPRPPASAVAAVAVLLLAVAALLVAGTRHAAPATSASAHGELVDDVLTACPQGTGTSHILTGSVPDATLGDSGRLAVRSLTGSSRTMPEQRGTLTRLSGGQGATVLEATGGTAPDHFGFLLDSSGGTLAALPCQQPRSSWWFAGAGATLDHRSQLVIANVDPGPAVVDVKVLGPNGPVDTVGTRGITVQPKAVHTLSLTDIAPQGDDLAVSVHASRGRVVAAVADTYAPSAGAHRGDEWLPDQHLPSRVVRIAPTPGRSSDQTLVLANPSSLNALVDLRVQGGHGTFTPTQHAQIQVPPGSTRAVDVSSVLGHGAAGIALHCGVPIVASVRSVSAGDSMVAAAVPPLEDSSAAAWNGSGARLMLTAGALRARASVAAFDKQGHRVKGSVLELGPGSTVSWSPPRRAQYLEVTPEEGTVHGAVLLSSGGETEIPLDVLPVRVQRPVVQPGVGWLGRQPAG